MVGVVGGGAWGVAMGAVSPNFRDHSRGPNLGGVDKCFCIFNPIFFYKFVCGAEQKCCSFKANIHSFYVFCHG